MSLTAILIGLMIIGTLLAIGITGIDHDNDAPEPMDGDDYERNPCVKKSDPQLRLQPWKIDAVFAPLERVLHRIEIDGIVDVAGDKTVFREDGRGGWYDLVAALGGIIQFHELAGTRHGFTVDLDPIKKLGAKLHYGTPLAMSDIEAVRSCINHCKRAAQHLRVSEACDIVNTVRISMELEKLKIKEAA